MPLQSITPNHQSGAPSTAPAKRNNGGIALLVQNPRILTNRAYQTIASGLPTDFMDNLFGMVLMICHPTGQVDPAARIDPMGLIARTIRIADHHKASVNKGSIYHHRPHLQIYRTED